MASRALLISMIVTILLCGAVTRFPATQPRRPAFWCRLASNATVGYR